MTTVDNKFSGFVKKADYGAEITKIKNDYATNASLDSKINDLKAEHIADEVKKVDEKRTRIQKKKTKKTFFLNQKRMQAIF